MSNETNAPAIWPPRSPESALDRPRLLPVPGVERPPWVLLSNHGYVLLAIAEQPTLRLRDIAERVGVTERAAMRIVGDLVSSGYVTARKIGRRNVYEVNPAAPLRHPTWSHHRVKDLLELAQRLPR